MDLSDYYRRGDCFPDLLARSVYLTKYCRNGETWTDTIRRVVEANCDLDPNCTESERIALFKAFWQMKSLPSGRALWVGGIQGVPVDARYNCYAMVLRSTDDWAWMTDMLMCGGGVGVSLLEINQLPRVDAYPCRLGITCSRSHPDFNDVMIDPVLPTEEIGRAHV